MTLTWKDVLGTLLVALAGALTYAMVSGFDMPLIGTSWSLATLLLLAIGFAASAFEGYGPITETNGWMTYAVVLGTFGVVAGVAGILFSSQFWFVVLAGIIFLLWAGSILYHLVTSSASRGRSDRTLHPRM